MARITTPMTVLAWTVLHDPDEEQRRTAAEQLARAVLDAEPQPEPDVRQLRLRTRR